LDNDIGLPSVPGAVKAKQQELHMTAYLVTYDLHVPGQEFRRLTSFMQGIDALHYQKSAWLVRYHGTGTALKAEILTIVDGNDKVTVAEVNPLNSSSTDPNVSLWLTMGPGILSEPVGTVGPFSTAAVGQPGILSNSILGSFLREKK
jgi:hypothetical protein